MATSIFDFGIGRFWTWDLDTGLSIRKHFVTDDRQTNTDCSDLRIY